MKTTFDEGADVLSILLEDDLVARTENIAPGVELDFDANGRLLSIEILGASKKYDLQGLLAKPPDPWLPLSSAASIFGVSTHSLRHQIHRGSLKAHKMGRAWIVHLDDLNDYLKKRGRESKVETKAQKSEGYDSGV